MSNQFIQFELFHLYVENTMSRKHSKLARAIKGGYYNEVKFFYEKNPKELLEYPDILIEAVTASHLLKESYKYNDMIKIIQFLTTLNEVEIDYQNKFGHTALIAASCIFNVKDVVPILLEAGASIDIENNNGLMFQK